MFIAQHTRCHTRLINKARVFQQSDSFIADTDRYLSRPDYILGQYGCANGESLVRTRNDRYFFDVINGDVIKYTLQGGIITISGYNSQYGSSFNMDGYFLSKATILKQLWDIYGYVCRVMGSYDKNNEDILLAFKAINLPDVEARNVVLGGSGPNIGDNDPMWQTVDMSVPGGLVIQPETIAFCLRQETRGWHSFFSLFPEAISSANNTIVAFSGGALWLHGENSPVNSFFGTTYAQQITFASNDNPLAPKMWGFLSLNTTHGWKAPVIATKVNISLLEKEHFVESEGRFHAAFLRDLNTPVQFPLFNGETLRGEYIKITIENSETVATELTGILVGGLVSPKVSRS